MRQRGQKLFATGPLAVLLPLACLLPLQAGPAHRHRPPPVISYVGGKRPHATFTLVRGWDTPPVFRLRTPRGEVTVRWREDNGTEDGGPPPMQGEIAHPDTIYTVVILSPPNLPVYFRGAGDAKWAHLNGSRVPATKLGDWMNGYPADPFRMEGGLNVVAVAYPDPE